MDLPRIGTLRGPQRLFTLLRPLSLAVLLLAATNVVRAEAELAVGVHLHDQTPSLDVGISDLPLGPVRGTLMAAVNERPALAAGVQGRLTFGPLGLLIVEAHAGAALGHQAGDVAGYAASIIGRGTFGPLAARLELARWTTHEQPSWPMLAAVPRAVPEGWRMGAEVAGRLNGTWLVEATGETGTGGTGGWTAASIVGRGRRVLAPNLDLGLQASWERADERVSWLAAAGVVIAPRRAPEIELRGGAELRGHDEGWSLHPVLMGSGALATEAGMASWDLTLRPGAAVEPGLEGRVSWEPMGSSPANVRYDLAFLQESIDGQQPRWSTRIGVQWTTQLDLR